MIVVYWLAFLIFLYLTGITAKRISGPSLSGFLLISFVLFVGSIIPVAFLLSPLNLTANIGAWIPGVYLAIGLHYLLWSRLYVADPFSLKALIVNRTQCLASWFSDLSPYLKILFSLLIGAFAVTAVTNFGLVLFTVPNEWDSMTGHLNRPLRYIQHGNMAHFGGTNWNMDTYPKSVTGIHIFTYLISGKIENAFKLIHYTSYWITIVAVFGTAQRIGRSFTASLFCAFAYALFLNFLMQAVTTETDVVLTAYFSCLLYFLFSFHATQHRHYLYLSGIAFAIALGHKITFVLLFPSVFMVMLYTVFLSPDLKVFRERFSRLTLALIIASLFYTLPTGYLKNLEVFGHPIGPPTALHHQSVERAGSLSNLLEQGSRNVVRYVYDFANLDGLRNAQWGYDLNKAVRKPLVLLEEKLNMRLDDETDFSIVPFSFQRRFEFYNANPYWGVFGFALILPIILLVLFRVITSRPHWFLSVAFVLHFLALSYSAPYDPFKGRYFIETGVFGALFLLLLFSTRSLSVLRPKRWLWKSYVAVVVLVASVSAIMTVFLNIRCLPLPAYGYTSAFSTERIKMQTFARPDTYVAYARFDSLVPQDATVALGTINDDFEYPLYGRKLTRKLISINPFEQGLRPIPEEADYLFFSKNVIKPVAGDIRLGTDTTMAADMIVKGEDYYLRKLK